MKKRDFIKTGIFGTAAITLSSHSKAGKLLFKSTNPIHFTQPKLPYNFDALEPYIDAKTMEIHYSKHHAGYTKKFNAALKDEGISGNLSAIKILKKASEYSEAIRNNGGGFVNHRLFWKVMSPDGGGEPGVDLFSAIKKDFDSFESFKKQFSHAAKSLFGSGWAWLIIAKDKKLKVTTTSNQDSPLMDTVNERGVPILCLDVWEHAYYLKYQNRRAEYVDNFWNIVNWKFVEEKYVKVMNRIKS